MAAPTVENVVQAVQALHRGESSANEWLTAFQSSPHAWSVVDSILHTEGLPMEVTFLAVQTLRSKMQRDFAELPAEQHLALRDSVVAHVKKFQAGPPVVSMQLCLSLAALAVQCEAWADVVQSVVAALPNEHAANAIQVLQLLPEECDSSSLQVSPKRRDDFRLQLGARYRDVMAFLCQCLGAAAPQTLAVRCFGAWLSVLPGDVPISEVAASPLVPLVFNGLAASSDTFDACIDCIAHLLYLSGGPANTALAEVIVPNVMALQPMFSQFLAEGDDSEDQARGLCRLFVELAETHAPFVLTMTPPGLQIVDAILLCGEHPTERIARMPFNFWYRLSQDVCDHNHPSHTDRVAAFTPYFTRWMRSLIALLRYPEDYDSQTADRQDDFKSFRYAVADAVVDACMVIKSETCLENFWHAFAELMGAEVCSWQRVEAVLYGVRSIARYISNEEAAFLPQFMQAIPTMPVHRPLQYTAALTIGACSEWLPGQPGHLGPLFSYLVDCLDSPEVADAAALSIKNVCDTCRHHFTEESTATSLMQLYEKTEILRMGASVELTQAITHAVAAMPEPMMMAALPRLVELPLEKVRSVIPQYAAGVTKETSKLMVATLKRLAAVFKVLDDTRKESGGREETRRLNVPVGGAAQHPCAGLMMGVWSVLDGALESCIADSATMENTCRALKYMISALQQHFAPLLPSLIQKLVACFQHKQHSCFLYLAATTVSIFGNSEDVACQGALRDMLGAFVQVVCGSVLSTAAQFTENPDVVEDFFDFVARYCRYCPALILHVNPAVMDAVIECGTKGFCLQHKEGSRSLMDFYSKLLTLGTDAAKYSPEVLAANQQALLPVFRPRGEALMVQLLGGVAGGMPASRCREGGQVVFALRGLFGEETGPWFFAALTALPSPRFSDECKQRWMEELLNAAVDRAAQHTLRQIESTPRPR